MKALFLSLLTLIACSSAFATVNANSSWEEINATPYLNPKAPTVYMGRSIDYMMVCRNGDRLQTTKPVDITETRTYGDRQEVVVVGREILSTPIHYSQVIENCFSQGGQNSRTVCKKHRVTGSYPMTVQVPVYQLLTPKRTYQQYRFTKSYTIPNCAGEPTPQ